MADLVAITETGINDSIHDGELAPSGYTILRCDRADGRKHGGVMLAATPRGALDLRRIPLPENASLNHHPFEIVCATVFRKNIFLFLCCVAYIPPKTIEREYMYMFHLLEQLCVNHDKVVLVADFNMYSTNQDVQCYYEYFVTFCGFRQCNNIRNCNNRTLDLVLTTLPEDDIVVSEESRECLSCIDPQHPPLRISISRARVTASPCGPVPQSSNSLPRWNYSKADFQSLYLALAGVDWSALYETSNADESYKSFYDIFYRILDGSTPRKSSKGDCSRYHYPEWFTADIISHIKQKAFWHKSFKNSRSDSDYKNFSYFRSVVKVMISTAYREYQNRIEQQFVKEPRSFWGFIGCKRSKRSKVKIARNGEPIPERECAQAFADYFHSVYGAVAPRLDAAAAGQAAPERGARVHVGQLSLGEVSAALTRLKPKRSVGPDGVPPFIVRDCRNVLARPLMHLFNNFLRECSYPDGWKVTRVTPVPKGAPSSDVSGYRPVAVLSPFAKVFESALCSCIQSQVASQLNDAQHGFRAGRSTNSNLMCFVNQATTVLDSEAGAQLDVAYFDFKKAFDSVDNDILLSKFARAGFTPALLKFFSSYLGNRKQMVEYAGYTSDPYCTLTGVSQGTNLGPLEFIIMVNDLPEVIEDAGCLLFADDLKLFMRITNDSHCSKLQRDIDRVVAWSVENNLHFNVTKCNIMSFTRAVVPRRHEYSMGGHVIPRVGSVRDLGVTFSEDLSFRAHVVQVCKKAFKSLGFVMRETRDFTNMAAVKSLYNALVRSNLETSAIIWNPYEIKYSQMVEKMQNKFTRYLYMRQFGVYPFYPLMYPTLFVIGMVGYYKLEVRRNLALVKYVFMVFRGMLNNPQILESLGLLVPNSRLRLGPRKSLFETPVARTNILKFAPVCRAITIINSISQRLDIFSCSLAEFQRVAVSVLSSM